MKIKITLDFFVDYLNKKNQQNIANFLSENKKKLIYFFNQKKQDLDKYFIFLQIWKNKIYLFFRKRKIEKYKYIFIPLNKIENIKLPTSKKIEAIQEKIITQLNEIVKYDYHTDNHEIIREQILLKNNWEQLEMLENELINQNQNVVSYNI